MDILLDAQCNVAAPADADAMHHEVVGSDTGYRQRLLEAGLLTETGIDGLYGRSQRFEAVVDGLDAMITAAGQDLDAEVLRFPPVLSQADFETSEYFNSCPDLSGTIHCFCGGEKEHRRALQCIADGQDWSYLQQPAGLAMAPAACYPVYPLSARRGPLPPGGRTFDVYSYCFRHEPSPEPTRMQLFRIREYVRIGTPAQAVEFRQLWVERGKRMVDRLGLPCEIALASDPFFGRAGKIAAQNQYAEALKFELRIPLADAANAVACLSFNLHRDFFSQRWELRLSDHALAHSACVGFGMERIALALFWHHGMNIDAWPQPVRDALWTP